MCGPTTLWQPRTHDGSVLRLLNIIDEYTRECLAIKAERHILAHNVVECLGDLFLEHGTMPRPEP